MPDYSSVTIPRPKDWQAFERQARLLFEFVLKDPNTQNNGRPGQRQNGVDIFGHRGGGDGPLVGVQCKGKDADYGAVVTEAELKGEVEKTKSFKPALKEFILITTADDDVVIQEKARLLEQEVRNGGRDISIAVWGWGRLQQEINRYPEAIKAFHPDASPFTDRLFDDNKEIKKLLEKQTASQVAQTKLLETLALRSVQTYIAVDTQPSQDTFDKYLHDQIDTYRDFIRNDRPVTAIDLLTKLKDQVWGIAAPKARFRILANIGAAHHRLGHYDVAADFFLEAAPFNPGEPISIANQIAALLIKQREAEAHALAAEAFKNHPDNSDICLQRLQARAPGETVEEVWNTLSPTVTNVVNLILFRIVSLRQGGNPLWESIANDALQAHPDEERFKIIQAEAILGRLIDADPSMLGFSGNSTPTQRQLAAAAETFEAAWNRSLGHETKPEWSFAHNAALARILLRQKAVAERLLDAALRNGVAEDQTKRLRLSLYPPKNAPPDALELADSLSDTPQSKVIRADFRAGIAPAEARTILATRFAFTVQRDIIAAALVFIESLIPEGKFDEALIEAERLQALLPDSPHAAFARFLVKSARGDSDANATLDEVARRISEQTDFATRFMVCDILVKSGGYDEVVDLLNGYTATTFDSHALRALVIAAVNADRRSILNELIEDLPVELLNMPFYRSALIAHAIRTGDVQAAEREIRRYLEDRPRDIEMHLQFMHALFRQHKLEELHTQAARPASDFDGVPEDFMKLAQFMDEFGDWREAHALAYRTLLTNPKDPAVNMGYIGVFLRLGHSSDLDITPPVVGEDMAVGLLTDDGKQSVYVLESNQDLRPTPGYLPLNHKIARQLIGQSVGSKIRLPDNSIAELKWIKPKVLHALHDLLENFKNFFPETEGFERVRIQTDQPAGLQPVFDRVRQRHDAIERVSRLYDSNNLPLVLTARALGSDLIETFLGLISFGHSIHVCEGTHAEREMAFSAIVDAGAKGCLLDAVTLHVVRRLKIEKAVTAICGPIGIADYTALSIDQKIYEIKKRIHEQDISLLWQNGQIYRHEVTQEQKREALAVLEADQKWIAEQTITIPAQGTKDPSPELRALMRRFGRQIFDDILAAQGSGRLFVCEDQSLRAIGQSEFGVQSTWLQPVLMKAITDKKMTRKEYQQAVLAFIDSQFEYVSIDAPLLVETVETAQSSELPKEFVKLAGRLGGEKAEIRSHLNVAFRAIADIWSNNKVPHILRLAASGTLLENLCKERPLEQVAVIIRNFEEFGLLILRDVTFAQYLNDWLRGHFIQ